MTTSTTATVTTSVSSVNVCVHPILNFSLQLFSRQLDVDGQPTTTIQSNPTSTTTAMHVTAVRARFTHYLLNFLIRMMTRLHRPFLQDKYNETSL